jgi:hypothetical protein
LYEPAITAQLAVLEACAQLNMLAALPKLLEVPVALVQDTPPEPSVQVEVVAMSLLLQVAPEMLMVEKHILVMVKLAVVFSVPLEEMMLGSSGPSLVEVVLMLASVDFQYWTTTQFPDRLAMTKEARQGWPALPPV